MHAAGGPLTRFPLRPFDRTRWAGTAVTPYRTGGLSSGRRQDEHYYLAAEDGDIITTESGAWIVVERRPPYKEDY